MRAEIPPKGTNTLFVVTTRTDDLKQVHDW
jgi:hypothetical protein